MTRRPKSTKYRDTIRSFGYFLCGLWGSRFVDVMKKKTIGFEFSIELDAFYKYKNVVIVNFYFESGVSKRSIDMIIATWQCVSS